MASQENDAVEHALGLLRSSEFSSALARAEDAARMFTLSPRAQYLPFYVQVQLVKALDRSDERKQDVILQTSRKLGRLTESYDRSMVISLYSTRHLILAGNYDAAKVECQRAVLIENPEDPILHQLPMDSFCDEEDFSDRLLAVNHEIAELQSVLEAHQQWSSMTIKEQESLISVNVEELKSHYSSICPSSAEIISKAVARFKLQGTWSLCCCPFGCDYSVENAAKLRLHCSVFHNEEFEKEPIAVEDFEQILTHIRSTDIGLFASVCLGQDSMQQDIFYFRSFEDMIHSMLLHSNGLDSPSYADMQFSLFNQVAQALDSMMNKGSTSEKTKAHELVEHYWNKLLKASIQDYRLAILPLVSAFKLKEMAQSFAGPSHSSCHSCTGGRNNHAEEKVLEMTKEATAEAVDCVIEKDLIDFTSETVYYPNERVILETIWGHIAPINYPNDADNEVLDGDNNSSKWAYPFVGPNQSGKTSDNEKVSDSVDLIIFDDDDESDMPVEIAGLEKGAADLDYLIEPGSNQSTDSSGIMFNPNERERLENIWRNFPLISSPNDGDKEGIYANNDSSKDWAYPFVGPNQSGKTSDIENVGDSADLIIFDDEDAESALPIKGCQSVNPPMVMKGKRMEKGRAKHYAGMYRKWPKEASTKSLFDQLAEEAMTTYNPYVNEAPHAEYYRKLKEKEPKHLCSVCFFELNSTKTVKDIFHYYEIHRKPSIACKEKDCSARFVSEDVLNEHVKCCHKPSAYPTIRKEQKPG